MATVRRPPSGADENRHLTVGTVRKPHGIKGELSIALETDRPEAVFRPGRTLWIGDSGGRLTGERLTVESSRPFKDGVLIRVSEHAARTEATDELRGRSLLIPESEAEPLEEGELFYHELVGMDVIADGETIGKIVTIHELPAGDLLAVRRENGGEILIPLVRDWIRGVRRDDGVLEIEPPAGLLDLQSPG